MREIVSPRGTSPGWSSPSRRQVILGLGTIWAASFSGGCGAQSKLDAYHPEDWAFFDAQNRGEALSERIYDSVKEITLASAAVITATVSDVRVLHELKSEDDHFFTYGWVMSITDNVRSRAESLGTQATVEMFGGTPDTDVVTELRERLPKSELLLFLRSNAESWAAEDERLAQRGQTMAPEQRAWRDATGDLHALVNSQAVCIQGEDNVRKPFRQSGGMLDRIDREVAEYASLSDLVKYVHTI